MAVSYTFVGNVLRINLEGIYPAEDAVNTFHLALDDPKFPENARLLVDVRRSESLTERRPEDLKSSVDFFAAAIERVGGRGAILAETEFQMGLMRMTAVYAETRDVECMVFSSQEEAITWLNRDLPGKE
jgi:hypothetical protein